MAGRANRPGIMAKLTNENPDHIICYQSRVGPLKWIGPSADEIVAKYSKERKGYRHSSRSLCFRTFRNFSRIRY